MTLFTLYAVFPKSVGFEERQRLAKEVEEAYIPGLADGAVWPESDPPKAVREAGFGNILTKTAAGRLLDVDDHRVRGMSWYEDFAKRHRCWLGIGDFSEGCYSDGAGAKSGREIVTPLGEWALLMEADWWEPGVLKYASITDAAGEDYDKKSFVEIVEENSAEVAIKLAAAGQG